ncbi:MAG: asparagine--tRNA ligase [bacterium]
MPCLLIKDVKSRLDEFIALKGWVFNFRSSGKIYFLQIRDGSGVIQAIVSQAEVSAEVWSACQKITIETSIEITGKVVAHPKQNGVFELQVKDLKIINLAEEYPIGKKEHGPDFLMDNRHLWLRSPRQWAVLRVRNTIINAIYEYLNKENFIKVDAPIFTPNACEGTTTLFSVDYFGDKAYLTQSGQLYIEAAIFSVGRCFDFGPVFRAEKSKTRRHLIEFWMMDAEAAFVEHEENMKIQEGMICHMVKKVLEDNKKELAILERDIKPLEKIKPPFYKITYDEAIKKLQELGSDIKHGDDFGADDETKLTKEYDRPVFVEKFPSAIKAFYMKRDPQNERLALCADLLATEGYGEIIGGSQREDDYDELVKRLKEHKLPKKEFAWYLDLRKYGSVPHSGFGIGLERAVAWICGLPHIRETIPFPRMLNRLRP